MHFLLRLIVSEKISNTFDMEYKYPKIIKATPYVQPSFFIQFILLSHVSCYCYTSHRVPICLNPFDRGWFKMLKTPHRVTVCLIPFNRGWFELRKTPHCVPIFIFHLKGLIFIEKTPYLVYVLFILLERGLFGLRKTPQHVLVCLISFNRG